MKKMSALLMAALLALTLVGCGSKDQTGQGSSTSQDDETGYAVDGYAEGRVGETMHTVFFDYTVNGAYVCDEYEGYAPAEGNELLVVDITVKNTHAASIPMWDDDFQAQWNDDAQDAYSIPITNSVEPLSDQQMPAEYELAVNEERTGLLVFEVPAGNKDFSISTLEIIDDGTEEGQVGDTFFVYFSAEKKA